MKPSLLASTEINPRPLSEIRRMNLKKRNISSTGIIIEEEQYSYSEYFINCTPSQSVKIETDGKETFYFIFCCDGELTLCLSQLNRKILLPYQGALYYTKSREGFFICPPMKGNKSVKVIVIKMSQNIISEDSEFRFFSSFKRSFQEYMPLGKTLFIGRPIPEIVSISEKLSLLLRKDNVAVQLMMRGLIFELIGYQMEQLLFRNKEIETGILTLSELEVVRALSLRIRENPNVEYTVSSFSKETGLSPRKLQEGFKRIYGRTVIDYVRDVRLDVAIELMKTTEMNISEIVYSIGFTSRSYFSKIFKRKYHCSPSYCLEMQRRCTEVA